MSTEIRPRSMLRPYQAKAADFVVAHPGSMLQVDIALGQDEYQPDRHHRPFRLGA